MNNDFLQGIIYLITCSCLLIIILTATPFLMAFSTGKIIFDAIATQFNPPQREKVTFSAP